MALNGISTLTIPTGLTATSFNGGGASSYLVAVGTFNYDAYGVGTLATRKDSGTLDTYMAQVIALGAGARNWTFVPANGQPSFTRSMNQPDGTGESNDPSESGVDIWTITTANSLALAGSGAGELNTSLIPNGTSFVIYATELGGGGGADKEARQIAKLDIAEAKRQGKVVARDGTITGSLDATKPYYRAKNTYDLAFLPTQYDGTDIVDNANTSGLLQGRPWYDPNTEATYNGEVIEVSPGIWRTNYEGYHYESANFFDTAALKAAPNNFDAADNDINEPDLPNSTSMMLKGYLRVTYTGNYTIYLSCDDGAYLWFGDNAITNWRSGDTLTNVIISNGGLHGESEVSTTVALTAGTYIPLRVMFGNGPDGPGVLTVSYEYPGQAKTSDFTGKIFYRTSTNGF